MYLLSNLFFHSWMYLFILLSLKIRDILESCVWKFFRLWAALVKTKIIKCLNLWVLLLVTADKVHVWPPKFSCCGQQQHCAYTRIVKHYLHQLSTITQILVFIRKYYVKRYSQKVQLKPVMLFLMHSWHTHSFESFIFPYFNYWQFCSSIFTCCSHFSFIWMWL